MFDISLNSLTEEIGEGAQESGRWCQASLDQGVLVSTATLRVATSNMHRHTEKLSGDTYQPLYSPRPAKRKERGKANCRTNARFGARNCTSFHSESFEAWQKPVSQIGARDPRTPLTSIDSILTKLKLVTHLATLKLKHRQKTNKK